MKLASSSLLIAAFSISASLQAQQDSHQHGVANLNLVLDQDTLMIEFESPAANIVGFEHKATSAAEKESIAAALRTLKNPQELMSLPADAGCRFQDSEVELHFDHEDADSHSDHDDADSHSDHDDADSHSDHDDADSHSDHDDADSHSNHEDTEAGHAEFHATYAFTCAQSSNLSVIQLLVFQKFPAVEEIHLQAITPWGQMGAEITNKNAVIRLK